MNTHSSGFKILRDRNSGVSGASVWQQAFSQRLQRMGYSVISYLAQNDEPQITQRFHKNGNSSWIIDEPCSNQQIVCSSEAEVRFWLETRYR